MEEGPTEQPATAAPVPGPPDRLERLQRISIELAAAVDVADVVDIVLRSVGGGAAVGLWLHQPGDDALALAGHTGFPEVNVARFARLPLAAELPGPVAFRTQRTVVSTSAAEAAEQYDLGEVQRTAEGFVAVPLVVDDRGLGVLGMGLDTEPDQADVAFLEAVAGQIAQTLARVRLTAREARRRFELEFLADLTDVALSAEDHVDLMDRVTRAAVPRLGDWCALCFVPEDSSAPSVTIAHKDPDRVAWVRELQARHPFDLGAPNGMAAVIRSGQTEHLPRITPQLIDAALAGAREDDVTEARAILDELGPTSSITVPLRTKHRTVGAMVFVTAESGREYDVDDVALAEAVAGRLAEALDSAWLSDQYRLIAVTLQRALLPPRLPAVPGIDVAARYWPAGGRSVGGDFYDVFRLDDGVWAVLIGDACGTGPNAAAITSIVRHTARAAARHGVDHATLMDWLNLAVLQSDRDLFCTACFATLHDEGDRWRLRSVTAGHPLPLIVRADGTTTPHGEPGTLLGVFDSIRTTVVDAVLEPGDAVIFYTDGITDLPEPYGLSADELYELVASLRERGSAADLADGIDESIRERVPPSHRDDDVAVVVLRVDPAGG